MPAILWFVALAIVAFGPGNRFRLEQSKDDFGMRSHGVIETLTANRTKFYPLPQSTAQDYARLRPELLRIITIARKPSDHIRLKTAEYRRRIRYGSVTATTMARDREASVHLDTSTPQRVAIRFSLRA